jgi:hypothetical protein
MRSDVPHFAFQVDLDGETYGFEFRWNERAAGYFFALYTSDGTPLLSGKRVVLGWPLLRRYADGRLPAGDLVAYDTTNSDTEPALGDLGARVVMLYYTADELVALGAARG